MDCSERHRHRCEVRHVLRWRFERGLQWVREWLDGGVIVNGRPTPSIEKVRGDAAAKRLRDDCREQWARGNRGVGDDWR